MSGRLNPREYDLGELRDAARRPPDRDGAVRDRPAGEPVDDDRSVAVEPTADVRDSPEREAASIADRQGGDTDYPTDRATDRGAEAARPEPRPVEDPSGDEVEAYLRDRHRRRDVADRPARGDAPADRRSPPDHRRSDPETAAILAELSGPDVSKPYLERLPDGYGAQLEVFEWLDGMLSAAGEESTTAALEYYESIGWLSERSRSQLEDVAAGLPAPEGAGRPFDVADHRESLVYVARLAGRLRG